MIPKVKIPKSDHKRVTLDFNLDFLRPKQNMPTHTHTTQFGLYQ